MQLRIFSFLIFFLFCVCVLPTKFRGQCDQLSSLVFGCSLSFYSFTSQFLEEVAVIPLIGLFRIRNIIFNEFPFPFFWKKIHLKTGLSDQNYFWQQAFSYSAGSNYLKNMCCPISALFAAYIYSFLFCAYIVPGYSHCLVFLFPNSITDLASMLIPLSISIIF